MMLNKLSLNTIGLNRIGLNRIGKPSRGSSSGSDRPYIDPEVLASLKAVCICYGKSNDDPDRAVVKNLVDPDNPFIISNAAFKLNSGFGEYEVDFLDWSINSSTITERTSFAFSAINTTNSDIISIYQIVPAAVQSLKIKVNLSGRLLYRYYVNNGDTISVSYYEVKEGINILPDSVDPTSVSGKVGFVLKGLSSVKLEQIPSFEGAFVTDRIGDLITSTKTVQEMLGGSNEITVVSLITHISGTGKYNIIGDGGIQVSDYSGQTFMAGTSSSGEKIVELGDKEKLQAVQYTTFDSKLTIGLEDSSYAYYGTFVFNKENVPVDWIHQVIAYFNLDRTLNPDILCNTIKQGITNENHAEFGDKLIDFSGNGRDIQLNNIAWDGDSGIGKYNYPNWKVTATIANTYSTIVNYPTVNGTYSINVNGVSELMQSIGLHLEIKYTTSTGIIYNDIKQDGVYSYILPDGATDLTLRFGGIPGIVNEPCNITITQIPSHAGALYLDGVNDFGWFVGDLGLKDYTFIADRAYDRIVLEQAPFIASKSTNGKAPFLMEYLNSDNYVYPHSFGATTKTTNLNIQRQISYQSTYVYNGNSISKGTSVDTGDGLTIGNSGSTGAQYSPLCLWSLMLFPYSMSEFLIERQLKKHKLGTLYPDMVEFRPVIKANANYKITYYQIDSTNTWKSIKVGDYIVIGAKLAFQITFDNDASELKEVVSPQLSGIIVEKRPSNPGYNIYSYITSKSPQKINITIDEYIRFEDIVQPYPAFYEFNDENRNLVTWGSKIKVGSTITRIKAFADSNLLKDLYNISYPKLNGVALAGSKYVVERQMVFTCTATWAFDNNEPKCILSPRLLRIPNSSYKILGYIPDISGHGNNGVIHNSAYAEGSGVNEDGSYQLDGVDDFVTIPTLSRSGKQVLMKVNWQKSPTLLYDQRASGSFAVLTTLEDDAVNPRIAYQARNQNGKTYIDGIENNNIETYTLKDITHNITIANSSLGGIIVPVIGCNTGKSSNFAKMSLYDFMLFDNISTDDKIKELNKYVGIEGNVWGILTQLSNSTLISNETLIKNE